MPGTCDSRPTRSPAAATWKGRREVSAGLTEADEQVDVLGPRLLLDDVLEQEIARVGVGALGVDGRAPARELRHVLVVLAHPGAELVSRQLALHPRLGERVQAAVAGVDGVLELAAELALLSAHGPPPIRPLL
jgi:hypothetical protein